MAVFHRVKRVGIIAGWQGQKALLEQAFKELHAEGILAVIGIDDILHGPQWRGCIDVLNARANACYSVIPWEDLATKTDITSDPDLKAYLKSGCGTDHDILRNGRRHGLAYLNPVRYAARLDAFKGDPAVRTDEQARLVFGWMAEQIYSLQIVGGGGPSAWKSKGGVLTRVDPHQSIILEPDTRYIVSPGTLAKDKRYCVLELGDEEKGETERIEPRQLR